MATIVEGFRVIGGKHCETTAANHVLRHRGIKLSEEMLLGLGGGIGFIYWYMKQMRSPLVGGRAGGRGFNLIDNAVRRAGGSTRIETTSSAKKARAWLDESLDAGAPLICYGDMAYLPYFGMSEEEHFGGHVFVVYGVDEAKDRVWIADRSRKPMEVTARDLARSRGSPHQPFPPAHMTVWVTPPEKPADLSPGILEAVRSCVAGMTSSPIGNFGLEGFKKWAAELKKWPRLFEGPALLECLMSTFLYIEIGGTGGSAFRKMYSVFLREAAEITGRAAFGEAAAAFDECALLWRRIAEAALPDAVEPLGEIRKRIVRKNDLCEKGSEGWLATTAEINREMKRLTADGARALEEGAPGIIEEMRRLVLELHGAETRAFEILGRA